MQGIPEIVSYICRFQQRLTTVNEYNIPTNACIFDWIYSYRSLGK